MRRRIRGHGARSVSKKFEAFAQSASPHVFGERVPRERAEDAVEMEFREARLGGKLVEGERLGKGPLDEVNDTFEGEPILIAHVFDCTSRCLTRARMVHPVFFKGIIVRA